MPGTAATLVTQTRVREGQDEAFAEWQQAISKAAAPSLTPDELPAVTVPLARKGVGNFASFLTVVPVLTM